LWVSVRTLVSRLICLLFGHGPVWFNVKFADGREGRCCGICNKFQERKATQDEASRG